MELSKVTDGMVHVSGGFIFFDSIRIEEDYFYIYSGKVWIAQFSIGAISQIDFPDKKYDQSSGTANIFIR